MEATSNRSLKSLKSFIKPLVPPVLIDRIRIYSELSQEKAKREKLEHLRGVVPEKVKSIRDLTQDQCCDASFLEKDFIPSLGLNDELLDFYCWIFSDRIAPALWERSTYMAVSKSVSKPFDLAYSQRKRN
jgi:hypothetical protein